MWAELQIVKLKHRQREMEKSSVWVFRGFHSLTNNYIKRETETITALQREIKLPLLQSAVLLTPRHREQRHRGQPLHLWRFSQKNERQTYFRCSSSSSRILRDSVSVFQEAAGCEFHHHSTWLTGWTSSQTFSLEIHFTHEATTTTVSKSPSYCSVRN